MVVLRLGKVNNLERKFIPTKKEYLNRYLKRMKKIEEYVLTQTYKDGYKYREYNDHGDLKYTKNNKMSTITKIAEISKEEFDKALKSNKGKAIIKTRSYYIDGNYEIDVDTFIKPIDIVMIEVSSDKAPLEDYVPPKGFIEVSGTKEYENYGIYNGSIKWNNIILEGTDGVGKTETIKRLLKEGIICQDREMDVISKNMLFEIPMEVRSKKYNEYLKNSDKHVIFLINKDKDELERRINSRDRLSEFDLEAFKYNKLYEDTYLYMKDKNLLNNKLHLIDCTGLKIDEQVKVIKDYIIKINA